jgi:uncharacterized membrane protein YoaK (UPF0700 family)
MLRKFSNSRTLADNIKLGFSTAFIAGMVNVSSLVLFFSFTSNITGHYAILADEISNGRWLQVVIVFSWILLFFLGSFLSNFLIIQGTFKSKLLTHSIPLFLEILCFIGVGLYGVFLYSETLIETELLVAVLLFAMGIQNGLTASISNFSVKSTHLTGLTTDLAIHISMYLKPDYKHELIVVEKIKLLSMIALGYVVGGIVAGSVTHFFQFYVFFVISFFMMFVILYDVIHLKSDSKSNRRLKKQVKNA